MKDSVNTLNHLLKGENMAIGIYEAYLPGVDDLGIREHLEQMCLDHREHAQQLMDRIDALGGKPEGSTGLVGFLADTKAKAATVFTGMTSQMILKTIYEGEKLGLDKAKEQLKGELDVTSRRMVSEIFSVDSQHLQVMEKLLNDYLH